MRLNEIASAEEQLALWKLISDNIWTAVSQQAEAERRQRAEKAAQAKLKPKIGGKRGGRKSLPPPPHITPPPPHITPPPPPKKPPPPQAKTEVGKQAAQQMGGGMKQLQPNATNPQQPNAVGMAQPQPNATNPQAAQVQQPQTAQQPLTPQQMRLQRQNVGNLAKNSAVKKRM